MIAFTAVYVKSREGYFAFVEELPGINAYGRSLDEARRALRQLAKVAFDEERRASEELIEGREVVREGFLLPARES
jgi:predicted RNase H-like HicB family nuclease